VIDVDVKASRPRQRLEVAPAIVDVEDDGVVAGRIHAGQIVQQPGVVPGEISEAAEQLERTPVPEHEQDSKITMKVGEDRKPLLKLIPARSRLGEVDGDPCLRRVVGCRRYTVADGVDPDTHRHGGRRQAGQPGAGDDRDDPTL
jgi:hypothetical protein